MNTLDIAAAASRLGLWMIVNSLWQGALIAGVTWLAMRLFSRANATTRYAVWSLALVAILVIPIVTSVSRVSVATPVQTAAPHRTVSSHRTTPDVRFAHRDAGESPLPRPIATAPSFALTVPPLLPVALLAVWFLGVLAILARLAVGLLQLEKLKHDSLPLDVAYRDAMPKWSAAVKGERDVRICVSDDVEVPVAVGLFDSMVLLPAHLVHQLDPDEIDQISLHELGHLLRADDWTNALQRIVTGLLFFNPAAWFAARQMDVEREVACDDYVLQLTGSVRPYAFCLTKMAEMTAWPHTPVPAPGVFVTRKNISIRIERLLRTGRAIGSSIAPSVAGVTAAALIAVFLMLRLVTPSIAFTEPAPSAPPVPAVVVQPVENVKLPAAPSVAIKSAPAAPQRPLETAQPVRVAQVAAPVQPAAPARPATHVALANDGMFARNGGCEGCTFNNANMRGRDLSNLNLEGSDFKGADLENARFDHANLEGANFSGADVRGASFVDASMEGANLRGARISGARFDGAELSGADIDAGTLSPDQARMFLTRCEGCDFKNADLHGEDLRGVRVEGANLSGADLRGTNLSGSSFEGVDFNGAKFAGANVDNATFEGCNFNGADLRGVNMSKASLTGSSMGGAIW